MTEEEIQVLINGHAERNTELLLRLSELGVDLEAPRTIDCHFWPPGELKARELSQALGKEGFTTDVLAPAHDGRTWNLQAQVTMSPINVTAGEFVEGIVRLAASHNTEFDGWGTAV